MEPNIKKRVLIVEDDTALRNVLGDKLEYEDFFILIAKNGEEGLKMALKNKPDLILLDILMPKMNGVDMLKQLRLDNWGRTVPVLLLTNDSNPEHMRQTLKDNAVDYLIKADWDLNSVIKIIKTKLKP
jgi:DNA-binding response OmpR family regulator